MHAEQSEQNQGTEGENSPPGKQRSLTGRLIVFAFVAALFGFLFYQYGDQLSLESVAAKEADVKAYQQEHPVLIYAAAFVLYAVVTGLSLPGATVLTLAFGWFFGFWRALPVVSCASTTGEIFSFLLSRYLFRDSLESKFGEQLKKFNEMLKKEGALYLFTLRLIPAVPFFIINAVMGLTPIRLVTYWLVSQLGMLPGTCVYVYFGSEIPSAQELAHFDSGQILREHPGILVAFVLLGTFPIVVKKIMAWVRSTQPASSS